MIQLGSKVKDKVSQYVGISTARTVYLNGCVRICIEGKHEKGEPKCVWQDEGLIKVLSSPKANGFRDPGQVERSGGPPRHVPPRH